MVCLMGVADKNDGLEGLGGNPEQSSRVQAVCSFFGPTDFTTKHWTAEIEKALLEPFLGASFEKDPAAYKKASPIIYVTKDDPPFLFIHGTKDTDVPYEQSAMMAKELDAKGVEHELLTVKDGGHGLAGVSRAIVDRTHDRVVEFLNTHVR